MSEREDRVLRDELDRLAEDFRREPLPAPSAAIDADIRRAARAALQATPTDAATVTAAASAAAASSAQAPAPRRRAPRWLLPASVAATVVLAVSVFLRVQESALPRVPATGEAEIAATGIAQDPQAGATAENASAAAAVTADSANELAAQADDAAGVADLAVPAEAAVAAATMAAPAPPPPPVARSMAAAPLSAEAAKQAPASQQQTAAAGDVSPSNTVSNVIVSEVEAPQARFERILALYREGRTDQAAAALAELERQHPDFMTPERRKLLPAPAPSP